MKVSRSSLDIIFVEQLNVAYRVKGFHENVIVNAMKLAVLSRKFIVVLYIKENFHQICHVNFEKLRLIFR